jgi:prepilin peptidase dependent protein B
MLMRRRPRGRRRGVRGMSLVELMVGVAVGLVVVAGAISLFATQVRSSRDTLLATRVTQDLRAAADLVARDLRRTGYWGNAINGTRAVGATAPLQNPYAAMDPTDSSVAYGFSRDAVEDDTLGDEEQFGFRLTEDGVLQMQTDSNTWQELIDPALVRVTEFTVTPTTVDLPLGNLCVAACPAATPGCPTVTVRRLDLLLRGQAVADPAITREQRLSVRLRNDQISGACPP